MKTPKLIIFDLDGTLVDAYPAIIESFNYTMRKLGYPARSHAVIRRAVGWGDKNLLEPFVKPGDLPGALTIYRRHHKKSLLKGAHLLPGAARVLAFLKNKGYKLAIASNRPSQFSWIIIRHLKLTKLLAYVLCADKLDHMKPHPEILNTIMHKFSLAPDEVIYVGDMAIDAQAGRRARVRTVIVTTGSSPRFEILRERPYRIIKRISSLPQIV